MAREETAVTDEDGNELANIYANLTECVYATVKEIVPEKKWIKKNGRVVSEDTKELFEKRSKEYKRANPTREQRKAWNLRIRNACRNDYRRWVATWVETIEAADNKGDTKTIYRGVKALGGSAALERTKPTERMTKKKKNPKSSNEIKSTSANGETETKILDNKNRTANKKAGKSVTEAGSPAANENTATQFQRPTRGQPRSSTATNEKAELDETENTATSNSGTADAHVGSTISSNKKAEPAVTENQPASKTPRPDDGQPGSRIGSPQELASVWQEFLDEKFSSTDLEQAREEYAALPESDENDRELTREEFNEAVKHMKAGKAPGMDNIPAEVWQRSAVAQDELFKFIQQVWRKEFVPPKLAVCIFVMIFKRKGSHNDCSKYRAIGLLNHAYKIMSVILLKRIVTECAEFLSEWQAGFRASRGCRDNILLLRMLYDYIIEKKVMHRHIH